MIPPVEAAATTTLSPSRDGRLVPYFVLAFGTLAAGVLLGEGVLVAVGVPFAVALALGLRRLGPVEVDARIILDSDQVLEGDTVTGKILLAWDGDFDAHLLLDRLKGVATGRGENASRTVLGRSSVELPVRMDAVQWGRHSLGELWLRLTLPFGLLTWTGRVMTGPAIRVLPGTERLDKLLSPPQSRAVWGMHGSSRLGDGHEFAELRPYAPGDRLRDLNWAATARHGRAFVNRHHPEVSGEVVIAIDALEDGSAVAGAVLARTARVAWGLASLHMRANDRVGLVGLGGSTQWLAPAGGRLAQYRLMETLLRIGGEAADRVMTKRPNVEVPRAALVIVLTTLHDPAVLRVLTGWRARGRSIAVVRIDVMDQLGPVQSEAERLARRLWAVELEGRSSTLREIGIPVERAPVDGAMTPVIRALQRARRTSTLRRSR